MMAAGAIKPCMMRAFPLAALALLMLSPPALAWEYCIQRGDICAIYEVEVGRVNAGVDAYGNLAGAGTYDSTQFQGTAAYVFLPTTYVAAYEGEWEGQNMTLVGVGHEGKTLLWFHQDGRASSYPSAYHCVSVYASYSRCGSGLP